MQALLGLLFGTTALAVGLSGCRPKSAGRTSPSASASALRKALPPLPPVAPVEKPEVSLCRVIALRPIAGGATDAGVAARAPAVGTALEGRDWLDLPANTELVLRHSLTTRELALRGPGRFLPCFVGSETVLVAMGAVKTTAGAGARAGAEVILATPLASVHFADAALELRVRERELDVAIEVGVATLVPAAPRAGADAGSPDVVLGPKSKKKLSGTADAGDLVERCREASVLVAEGPPAPPRGVPSARAVLGQWSVAQLKARQGARWACAAARAAAGRAEGAERKRLWDLVTATDRVWQAPPEPGGL